MRCILACLLAVAAMSAEVEVRLRAQVLVGADRATLADAAELSGDQEAIARIAALTVAELPTLTPVTIDARLITALATRAAAPATLRISGAGSVARRSRVFTAEELCAAAQAIVSDATTTVVRCTGSLVVPDAPDLVLRAEPIDRFAVGEVPFRVRAMAGTKESARALVVLHIERIVEVVVAARDLERGEPIAPGDLRCERRRAERSDPAVVPALELFAGQTPRRRILAGEMLTTALVAIAPVVRAGSTVSVVYPGRDFSVETQAVALADARLGERFGLRRVADGTVITAVAQADGRIVLRQ